MRIQYISDIHLEFMTGEAGPVHSTSSANDEFASALLKAKRFSPKADILCLAGDIGYPDRPIYRQFLKSVSTDFKKVFLIAGNHEYYGCESMDAVHETIRGVIADLPNITFLDNSYEDYEGFRFVGSTLWSKIPCRDDFETLINDFSEIGEMTPALYNELHLGAYEFLESAIEESPLPVVVMTHHLPSFGLIDAAYVQYVDMNAFFASSCESLFKSPLTTWIYGHTHTPARTIRDGITFACNPVGYPSEAAKRSDLNAVIDIGDA